MGIPRSDLICIYIFSETVFSQSIKASDECLPSAILTLVDMAVPVALSAGSQAGACCLVHFPECSFFYYFTGLTAFLLTFLFGRRSVVRLPLCLARRPQTAPPPTSTLQLLYFFPFAENFRDSIDVLKRAERYFTHTLRLCVAQHINGPRMRE